MTSVVNSSGVDLSSPTGVSGDVLVPDAAGGTKLAAAVVDVNPADGSATQPAILANQASIIANQATIIANQGVGASGISEPSGGQGILGWLSGIYHALTSALTITGTVAVSNVAFASQTEDGAGAAINSLAAGSGQNGLMVAIGATNYFASAANSSVAQLAAGATFAGAIENAFNEPAVSVLLTSDQPGILTINQFVDLAGAHLVSSWIFQIAANVPYSRAFTLNGNFIQVSFQNTGAAPTTVFDLNTAYGTIPAVTQQGNAPVSIYDANGVALGSDIYGGSAFLHVDSSHAATDGSAYGTANVPQVGVVAGKGSDGFVHALATDAAGNAQVNLVGNATGDFAGLNLLEELIHGNNGLDLGARITNLPVTDVNRRMMLSDAPAPLIFQGEIGGVWLIDTTGYQSVNISATTLAGSVQTSNDGQIWSALTGTPAIFGTPTSSVAAGANYSFPVIARFIKITLTTAGWATAYLRATPWVAGYSNEPVNVAQLAGTAPVTAGVAGTQAVGGNIAVGSAQTTNPLVTGGVDAGGLTRRLLTDAAGRIQSAALGANALGVQAQLGLAVSSNSGLGAALVQESSFVEGSSLLELMSRLLTEMQITNQQLYDIKTGSASFDDPAMYRLDQTLFN